MKKRGSFFERLTGSVAYDDSEEEIEIDTRNLSTTKNKADKAMTTATDDNDGQLTVDVYQTPNEIIIETMISAVKPDDLDISITREMVTIRGTRERGRTVEEDQYFFRELYWGSFSRTILLPQEIEPELADAKEKNGLLTIILPKVNKDKLHKLRVKSGQG